MEKLADFIKLFEQYCSHTNLMSKNDVCKLAEKHIPDCLSIDEFFVKYGKNIKNIADIGTGGGLPSVPISLKYPNINVFAFDSVAKKIKFIEIVKKELQINNLYPFCTRMEDYEKKEFFDAAVSRACANLSTVLEYAAPFVKKNGYIIAYKSTLADEELKNAKKAINLLKLTFIEKIITSNTEDFQEKRCLLIFKKIEKTPIKYPRKNNLPRKKPL